MVFKVVVFHDVCHEQKIKAKQHTENNTKHRREKSLVITRVLRRPQADRISRLQVQLCLNNLMKDAILTVTLTRLGNLLFKTHVSYACLK